MPKIVDHDARREEIAQHAVRAVATYGLDRVKLEHVAEMARCTTGSLMHFYPNKRAILDAALNEVMSQLAQRYEAALTEPDLVEALSAVLPLDAERRREWRVWVSYFGMAAFKAHLEQTHHRYFATNHGWVLAILEAAVDRGDIRSDLPLAAIADHLISITDGLGMRATLEPESWGPADLKAHIASFVGLLR